MRKSMRSRVGIGAGALLGLCLAALPARAQDKPVMTSKDKSDTVKVTVNGDIVLDYVWRGREINEFVFGGGAASQSRNDFEGYAAIRLNADLSDKVSAMVEIGTKRVDAGGIVNWGTVGSTAIQLREGQVNLTDFLMADLKAQVGITTWSFDMRGKGSSMAFDLRHSQQITRNMTGVSPLTTRDNQATLGARASDPEELNPVGLVLTYGRDAFKVDAVILPAIVEGGFTGADEGLYALDFMYNLDSVGKGSHMGAIIALHQFNSANFAGASSPGGELMWTIGGGADLKMMDGSLELYGEVYAQFGTVDKPQTGSSVKAGGLAFQLGAEYHLPNNQSNLWGGINYTYFSGDKDTTANTKMQRFAGYENIHDLMILEDMYTGFDWDSNYWAFKLNGGLALSLGSGKNNLELSAIVGFARTQASVDMAGGLLTAATSTKKLGDEVDLKARWLLNKQASINIGVGFLFSSDVLKDSMLANSDNRDKTGSQLYTIGLDLKF
jgi:hypothetical protein